MASGRALFVILVKKVKKFPILSAINNSQNVKRSKLNSSELYRKILSFLTIGRQDAIL